MPTRPFADAVAWYEDYAFLQGNGVGKPLGALQSPCAIAVNRQNANTFAIADAANMLAKLLPQWDPQTTCWIVSPSVLSNLATIAAAGTQIQWTTPPTQPGKLAVLTLLGLPVQVSEKMSQLGTARDVALCDFRFYLIGDRRQIDVTFSAHAKLLNNQAAWKFVSRVDGQPWLSQTVTLQNGQTASNVVYLN
jgi:HK97 family phage major capsid protein